MYEKKIDELALEHVAFRTVWLDAADYPRALANAHLGVSLHTSSSGLDLPMKIVDMFGASLPVAAMRYDVIGELVQEGVNGVLFADATELAAIFTKLLRGETPHAQGVEARRGEVGRANVGRSLEALCITRIR